MDRIGCKLILDTGVGRVMKDLHVQGSIARY